ncbi:hypothetical protein MKY34_17895 [Sporosarcina sp. FSL K6-1522]|uniref:hypothetical protein n=1 Tax=Sporosarcina sp. FSL K6-1522 TaxID=2921554 RepID=UPI003159F1D7
MNAWLTDMEGLFQAGVSAINFVPSQWNVQTFRSGLRTEMFPKVYLNPGDLWIKEQEQLIGTMITAGTFRNLEGKKVQTIGENVGEDIKYHAYENGLLIKEYRVGQTVYYEVVSKVEYKDVEIDKPKENKVLDTVQFVLDIAGLVHVVGEVADGANGIIYSVRGDVTNAALSFGAMIPVAGWASTGGKFAVKGQNLYQVRNVVSTENVTSIYSPIYQDVVGSSLGKTQNQLDLLSTNYYRTGTDAFAFNMPSAKMDISTSVKSGNIDVGAKSTGEGVEHVGKLKGKEVLLKDVLEREVTYTKRDREEFKQLRNKFNSSVRKNYLLDLASDKKKIEQLFDAGLTEADIKNLKNGLVPDGYQVHHKLPLDDGGTNDFKNLILIKNDPYHKVLTNSQKSLTKGMKVGDSIDIKWPIPEGFIYPTTK